MITARMITRSTESASLLGLGYAAFVCVGTYRGFHKGLVSEPLLIIVCYLGFAPVALFLATAPSLRKRAARLLLQGCTTVLLCMLLIKLISRRIGEWLRTPFASVFAEGTLTVFFLEGILAGEFNSARVRKNLGPMDLVKLGLALGLGYWLVNAVVVVNLLLIPLDSEKFDISLLDILDLLSLLPMETAATIAIALHKTRNLSGEVQKSFRVLAYPICVNILHCISIYIAQQGHPGSFVFSAGVLLTAINTIHALSQLFCELYTIFTHSRTKSLLPCQPPPSSCSFTVV